MMSSFELKEKIFEMQALVAPWPNGIMVPRLQAASTTIMFLLRAMFQGMLIIEVHQTLGCTTVLLLELFP